VGTVTHQVDVLVVTGDSVWPPINGGRERTAGIVEALAESYSVSVAAPGLTSRSFVATPVPTFAYRLPKRQRRLAAFASARPRLGNSVLDRRALSDLAQMVIGLRPSVLLFTHSYLASTASRLPSAFVAVDFPNVESERLRSLARDAKGRQRLSRSLEAAKAHLWEPPVARRADLVSVVSQSDAARLTAWGASSVVVVPNASRCVQTQSLSPAKGPVVFLASAGYPPNDLAAERLVRRIWPKVIDGRPDACLLVIGRETDRFYGWARNVPGVAVLGEVPEVSPHLLNASVVVAPVEAGGGTQLKVVNALGHGRVVVATPFSARSAPAGAVVGCLVAEDDDEFAARVIEMLRNVSLRHGLERRLQAMQPVSWSDAVAPLARRLEVLIGG
jgi:Glycosyl transferases group 1/Glycosyl transferase 4-like domain